MPVAIYLNLASVRLEKAVALALVLTLVALAVLTGVRLVGKRKA
jgi:ABC-type sulfate transport system permease component